MKFDEFNESWPAWKEGEAFADHSRIEDLYKERKSLPSGRWLWGGIPIVAAIGKFSGWSEIEIFEGCAAIALFEVVDLLTRVIKQNHDLRIEIENLRGSVRENRWFAARNHEISMKTGRRDEFGSPM